MDTFWHLEYGHMTWISNPLAFRFEERQVAWLKFRLENTYKRADIAAILFANKYVMPAWLLLALICGQRSTGRDG